MHAIVSPPVMHLLFGERFVDIWLDVDEGWIYLDWKGQQTQETVRIGAEKLLEMMVEHQTYRILNDNTHTTGSWVASIPWVIFNFLPRAKKAGLKRIAHVYARDRLARISADAAKLLIDLEAANIRLCNTLNEAQGWLREMPHS